MKTIKNLMLALATFLMSSSLRMSQPENHICDTTQHMNHLMKKNPGLEQELKDIEVKMQKWAEESGNLRQTSSLLPDVIPVVVHVLYSQAAENVSDQVI